MRLIDADELLEREQVKILTLKARSNCKSLLTACKTYLNLAVENAPTVEAVPVVHAKWREKEFGWFFECSNCGYTTDFRLSNYCPECGAKMDGDQ